MQFLQKLCLLHTTFKIYNFFKNHDKYLVLDFSLRAVMFAKPNLLLCILKWALS